VTGIDTIIPFFLSCIYARNVEVDQACLWNSLRKVGVSIANDPWLLIGDFNVCQNGLEMRGGNAYLSLGMLRFNGFLSSILL